MGSIIKALLSSWMVCGILGCSGILKKQAPEDGELETLAMESAQKPMSPEKSKEMIHEVGESWLYGPGLGDAMVNVGTSVMFPPYIALLLGNAALSLTGYEPITIGNSLPEESGKVWKEGYDSITSVPGRMAAAVAGEEFRTKERARVRLKSMLEENEGTSATASQEQDAPQN